MCVIPSVNSQAQQAIKTIRYASFGIHAPRLFNTLPADIRNTTGCSVDIFKNKLAKFLKTVPDEPQIAGYTAYRRADSNSLIDMHKLVNAQLVYTLEEDEESATSGGQPWTP